ncbi:MAG: DUF2237 domain-containing protein [Bacteroidales bacterium]|nr:DUF2237 domain-containing protein [Bacteroidales bacterium]
MPDKNVFGEDIVTCSNDPKTGFFRDGCCNTDERDVGEHTVCVITTEEFLIFSKKVGNDLSTPKPAYSFKGLKPGDKWCLCALRWVEAYKNNAAPYILLEATNEKVLKHIPMKLLLKYAYIQKQNSR